MNEELIAAAELGEEARNFLASDLGKVMLGIAKQEVQLAQAALLDVKPTDAEAITLLQNKARLGLNFEQWLLELLSKGENALAVFRQEQQT